MKAPMKNILILVFRIFPNIIPFAIEFIIFTISFFAVIGVRMHHSWEPCMTIALSLVVAVILNGIFAVILRFSNWTIEKFAAIGKKYATPHIIKDVRENYASNSLSDKAKDEVYALLREYGMDGLPEDTKKYIRDHQALEEMITRFRRCEEERITKRNSIVIEYTKLFFACRLEDYSSLENSIHRFLVCMDADMRYELLTCNNAYNKNDIRVFCSNVQQFCEIPVEVMAKFQEKVFGNWFPDTTFDSLKSNFSKTSRSKFSTVSDSVTLEDIVANWKETYNQNNK